MASHYKGWPNAGAFNALGDTRTKVKLNISGHFPDYAAGVLYRTGPGGYKVPRIDPKDGYFAASHWFDGFFTTHRFELVQGVNGCSETWYSSRSHVDELIETARRTGKYDGITFGQKRDPCDTFYKKLKTVFEPTALKTPETANIGVSFRPAMPGELEKAGRALSPQEKRADSTLNDQALPESAQPTTLLLTTDTSSVKTFDAATLEPLGVTNQTKLHSSLKGQLSAAHAAEDRTIGEFFNYNLAFGKVPTYKVFSANPTTGEVRILATICEQEIKAAFIHSMFCTPNFVILCVWNSFFKPYGFSVLWERNLMDAMATFDSKSKATWLIIDRHHGRGVVKKFTSSAFFAFHTTNAWEEKSSSSEADVDIVCELYQFGSLDVLHSLYYENLVSNEKNTEAFHKRWQSDGKLARYRLAGVPLQVSTGSKGKQSPATAERVLSIENAGDLQTCNPNYHMKPHRYVWSVLDRGKSSFVDGLGKTDTGTGSCTVWEQEHHTPGKPVFLPASRATAEDEGVILTAVLDGDKGTSYLLCLDAQNMKEVGRAELEVPVGLGLHGLHVKAWEPASNVVLASFPGRIWSSAVPLRGLEAIMRRGAKW